MTTAGPPEPPTPPVPAPDLEALYRDAVVYEVVGHGDPGTLFPEESALVERAVENRRRQFAAGRSCARRAMERLGQGPGPLPVGPKRAPAWPPGVRGSITHTEGYAAASVRRITGTGDGLGIGIDAEQLGRVTPNLWSRLFTPAEQAWLNLLPTAEQELATTAVFGAKEAFYKAQFPFTGAWVGFQDVTAHPADPETGEPALLLEPATDLAVLARFRWPITARYLLRQGIVISTVEAALVVNG